MVFPWFEPIIKLGSNCEIELRNPPTGTHELGTLQALTENIGRIVSVGRWIWAFRKPKGQISLDNSGNFWKKNKHSTKFFRFCSNIRTLRFDFASFIYYLFLFRVSSLECWFRQMSPKAKMNLHGPWPTCHLHTLFLLCFHRLWPHKIVICGGLKVYS